MNWINLISPSNLINVIMDSQSKEKTNESQKTKPQEAEKKKDEKESPQKDSNEDIYKKHISQPIEER